jgi:hypothetical protein
VHRQGLTREHGFIYLRLTFKHHAVSRKAFTGQDHQAVTHQQFFDGNFHLAIQGDDARARRAQGMQGTNGIGGLALGTRL